MMMSDEYTNKPSYWLSSTNFRFNERQIATLLPNAFFSSLRTKYTLHAPHFIEHIVHMCGICMMAVRHASAHTKLLISKWLFISLLQTLMQLDSTHSLNNRWTFYLIWFHFNYYHPGRCRAFGSAPTVSLRAWCAFCACLCNSKFPQWECWKWLTGEASTLRFPHRFLYDATRKKLKWCWIQIRIYIFISVHTCMCAKCERVILRRARTTSQCPMWSPDCFVWNAMRAAFRQTYELIIN